ncbi:ATP-binding cassette domain-containing protein [Vibrio metschnikovii]|uniref:ATP-binding cassette domain-containing protein n=2 Tax=Unclassified Bacteria TaxID=49928 RepID=A0AAU6US78_UNCXX|nr:MULTISPECIES: ATP-binding cassette domain-containing protein [unclassified Vibrio]EKO3563777.1 ATP-binding cassette domain-containing protein [Vibrio metschnikovii]EKO3574509.1 ATP-binding cassette domain-containing protein [Vibrio metschnikovii]EKO3592214.1 ATP-binding cassette domain-containing protein [Vibrio metschnikovii]EKO3597915.1 ATP-binding cassette domain-containing protein [Vibrio metschnikovii]EKO3605993.1 ATP-binding cassette domain-containing protein [Vibrio metschnikovii]
MFRLVDATFNIDEKLILSSTNLTFEPGKITTLLGHNGCGKSTLIKLLSRQNKPSSGQVFYGDQPAYTLNNIEFAHQVAYLPQHPPMTAGVTVRELVCFGRYPWKGALGRYDAQDYTIVDEAIAKVGLSGFSDNFVATLSGGERQRAWVAMLLAQQSQTLLLDEPTSALDVAHQHELLTLLRELNQSLALTVIMVLHDVNMAAKFSDHLIALHSGRVIAHGTPEQLMNRETLLQIYGMELAIFTHPRTGQMISYIP